MWSSSSSIRTIKVPLTHPANIDLARAQLHELLANKSLAGIPLLALGNKNDLEGALSEK
jgi:hypothetical protein